MASKARVFAHNRTVKNPDVGYRGNKGKSFHEDKKREKQILKTEEEREIYPLGLSGNFLEEKNEDVKDIIQDLMQIRNIDKTPIKNSAIEIEIRMLGQNANKASDKFNRTLTWLKEKLSNFKEQTFRETKYSPPSPMTDYYVDVIYRDNVKSLKFKRKGKDIIPLATIGDITPKLGISLETPLSIDFDISKTIPIISQRTRYTFDINSTTHIVLGLEPAILRYNMFLSKTQETFPITELVKAKVDLTKSEDTKTGFLNYSIEIELDTESITELSPSQINFLDLWIKVFAVIINRTGTLLTTTDLSLISMKVNRLLPVSKGLKSDTIIPPILVNQPKDLQKRDVSWLDPTESPLFMQLSNYDDQKEIQYNTLRNNKLYFPLLAIEGGYHVSLKADGKRYLLFFSDDGIYLLNPLARIITKISGTKTIYPDAKDILTDTVFDCELISKIDETGIAEHYDLLAFDILALEGQDVRNFSYNERINKINSTISLLYDITTKKNPRNPDGNKNIPFLTLAIKPSIKLTHPQLNNSNNDTENNLINKNQANVFFQQMQEQIEKAKQEQITIAPDKRSIRWKTDGLIFTPSERPYLETSDVFHQNLKTHNFSLVRKWKPYLTIDFYVTRTNAGLFLMSWFSPPKYLRKKDKEYGYIPFKGTKFYSWNGNFEFNESMIDKIYEFEWKWSDVFLDYAFVPLRERPDRDVPNDVTVAKDVWNLLNDPIAPEDITGNTLSFMRRYHNKVKTALLKDLLQKMGNQAKLLDLGSGQGGDQNKWHGFEEIYTVEPDEKNLRAFISRLENRNEISETIIADTENRLEKENGPNENYLSAFYSRASSFHARSKIEEKKQKIEIINAKVEDGDILMQRVPLNKINCCTMFNALTFFYENREKLNLLIDTVKRFLVRGGYFYCIALDGEALLNSMKVPGTTDTYNTIQTKNILIRKAEDTSCRKIYIKIEGGIVRGQYEYLINTEEFVELMSENGFRLVGSSYLNEETLLSAEEYWFSSMFKVMKFKYVLRPKVFGQGLKIVESKSEIINFSKILVEKMQFLKPLDTNSDPQEIRSTKLGKIGRLIRFGNPQDGSCYIHGMLRAFSGSYRKLSAPERQSWMVQLRSDMSKNYTQEIHDAIGNGFFKGSQNPAYTYANIKEALAKTTFWITQELMEFIGDQLETNVYILRGIDAEPYRFGYANSHIKPGRKNIVLYWINDNHYETVGFMENQDTARTVFDDNHPLILELKKSIV